MFKQGPILDFEGVFSRTVHEMIEEEFSARGIDSIDEETLDGIIAECVSQYGNINRELREQFGIPLVPMLRMKW